MQLPEKLTPDRKTIHTANARPAAHRIMTATVRNVDTRMSTKGGLARIIKYILQITPHYPVEYLNKPFNKLTFH